MILAASRQQLPQGSVLSPLCIRTNHFYTELTSLAKCGLVQKANCVISTWEQIVSKLPKCFSIYPSQEKWCWQSEKADLEVYAANMDNVSTWMHFLESVHWSANGHVSHLHMFFISAKLHCDINGTKQLDHFRNEKIRTVIMEIKFGNISLVIEE